MNGAGGWEAQFSPQYNPTEISAYTNCRKRTCVLFTWMDPERDRVKIVTSEVSSKMTPGKYVPLVFPKC